MLKQSFNQIIRSLWRHKSLTFSNLLGLSIGIAAVVVLFLIAHYENNLDDFHSYSEAFALTSVLAVAIAFITVSFQAIKAATVNPVKNLRTE